MCTDGALTRVGFSNHCYNIHGPLFFFFVSPRQKKNKKFKHKVWMLTQICHAIRVVLLLQKKQKKTKNKTKEWMQNIAFRTNLHPHYSSPLPARRSDPSEGEKKKGQRLRFNPPRFHFSYNNKMYSKRGACAFFLFFFFFFYRLCYGDEKQKLKAKVRKKQKTGAACSEGICDYHWSRRKWEERLLSDFLVCGSCSLM